MTKIAFVTDSTAYLTPNQVREHDITVVPLSVIFEGESYQEGVDLGNEDFYNRLRTAKALPTTSQPPAGQFVEVFQRLLQTHDVVMCLLLSAGLSGTLASAQTAASMVEGRVIVVDSKIASYGIAGPLLDGVHLARMGATPEEIQQYWEVTRDKVEARFVVDTLEFLHKGGRIGGAAAIFGALLQIKPILTVNAEGKIDLYEKVRTHRKAMDKMLSDFDEAASQGKPMRVGVVHAQREGDAKVLMADLIAKYPNVRAELSELGPVVGAHAGPGLLALLWYETEEKLLEK